VWAFLKERFAGKENAASRMTILTRLNMMRLNQLSDREFREIVSQLVILPKSPICSTPTVGYFVAKAEAEKKRRSMTWTRYSPSFNRIGFGQSASASGEAFLDFRSSVLECSHPSYSIVMMTSRLIFLWPPQYWHFHLKRKNMRQTNPLPLQCSQMENAVFPELAIP